MHSIIHRIQFAYMALWMQLQARHELETSTYA
jgi:hypothetical protein